MYGFHWFGSIYQDHPPSLPWHLTEVFPNFCSRHPPVARGREGIFSQTPTTSVAMERVGLGQAHQRGDAAGGAPGLSGGHPLLRRPGGAEGRIESGQRLARDPSAFHESAAVK